MTLTMLPDSGVREIIYSFRLLFAKKWKFSHFGAAYPPRAPIGAKFRVAKWTHVPLGHAKFHVNRYESPLRGEYADFRLLSKNNTGSLPLRIPPGKKKHTNTIFSNLQLARVVRSPKLCMVIEDVETITKRCQSFFDQRIFPTGCTEKFEVND